MKKILILAVSMVIFAAAALSAQERPHNPFDPAQHDPNTLYKIKDQMMQMSYLWIDLQLLSNQAQVDHKAIHTAVSSMEKRAKTIKNLNKNPELDGLLVQLIGRMKLIEQNNKKKNIVLVRQNLDFMSDTCFKCHAAHADPDKEKPAADEENL